MGLVRSPQAVGMPAPQPSASRRAKLEDVISLRHLRLLLPIWIALLFGGSFLPQEGKRALGTQSGYGGPRWGHRAWHVASFAATGILLGLAYRSRRGVLLLGLFGLGLMIEVLQVLVFGIGFEWWDVRDDGFGVVAAGWLSEVGWLRRLIREEIT
jgi:hypothetical protein